jgi:ankyrin repeat protein
LNHLLHQAIISNEYDKAVYLVSIGANVNERPPSQSLYCPPNYPIRNAVERGNIDILKLLLDNGADPNKGDPLTAILLYNLHYERTYQMITLLLEYGVDPNVENRCGNTPLDMLISDLNPYVTHTHKPEKYMNIAKLLISGGAYKFNDEYLMRIPVIYERYFRSLNKRQSPYETSSTTAVRENLLEPAKKIQKKDPRKVNGRLLEMSDDHLEPEKKIQKK